MSNVTRDLAEFAVSLRFDKLPESVRERVKDLVLDAVASALFGYDAAETCAIAAFARSLGSSSESSVIGGGRMTPAGATIVNGYLITAITVCDMHRPTTCHVTPQVVAPSLVEAERQHASGHAFLSAVAAGLEVTTRVGLGLKPAEFRSRGWHAPGVIGPFGGAAAVGSLIGLTAEQQARAFGLAASQAGGTYANLGTPTVKFHQARAALSGLMAAQLAGQDFGACTDVLTHPNGGLFNIYSDGGDPAAVLAGIGEQWEILRISYRPWPVAIHLQPVVTGVMQLLASPGYEPGQIRRLRLSVSPLAYDMHADVPWNERFQARLSARYVTAVALVDGRCGLDQFTAERIGDPAIAGFIRDRITIEEDPRLQNGTARLGLEMSDGTVRSETILTSKGEPTNPVSRAELIEKFRLAGRFRLPASQVEPALGLMLNLDQVEDTALLLDCLRLGPDLP